MKYNRAFISAVHATAEAFGNESAEAVFNKLFGVEAVPEAVPVDSRNQYELLSDLNEQLPSTYVYISDIEHVTNRVGTPRPGCSFAVAWIKAFRENTHCGLKEAKDVYDFVRDNPTILTSD